MARNRKAYYAANRAHIRAQQRAYYATKPQAWEKARALKKKYGLTFQGYCDLADRQKGLCAICQVVLDHGGNTHVDHDHETNVVRGLLCGRCNRTTGMAGDNPAILRLAAVYLERHKGV